jgi:hypothetical protein
MLFIYRHHPVLCHPQVGFIIGLGSGVNASGETWHLASGASVDDLLAKGFELLVIGQAEDVVVSATAPWLVDQHAAKIRNDGSLRLLALAGPYLPEERETWTVQKAESEAWLADPSAPTPMLSAMASTRSMALADLVARVIENVALFQAASGMILGTQQALLDLVYADIPLVDALAVAWPEA